MDESSVSAPRRAWRALLLLALSAACVALAVGAFFLAARFVDRPAIAAAFAATVLVGATFGVGWWRAPGLGVGPARRRTFSRVLAALSLVVIAPLAWWAAFVPVDAPAPVAAPVGDTPSWALPTGSRIAYQRIAGREPVRATPLLYLHGGPAVPARSSMRDTLAPLANEGFDVYVYDQYGSGASGRAADVASYTLERHVADLEAIRHALAADRVVLVGSSWGAVLAAHYMAMHTGRVERAVLLSPGILVDRAAHPYDFSRTASSDDDTIILPPLRMIVAGALARMNPAFAQAFASQDEMGAVLDGFTGGGSLEYQAHCKGHFAGGRPPAGATRARGGNYYANLLTLKSLREAPDPRPALRSVDAPVLLVRGACDYIPMSSAQAWRDALPRSSLVEIPGAGHALTAAAPEAVLAIMRAFLVDGTADVPSQARDGSAAVPAAPR